MKLKAFLWDLSTTLIKCKEERERAQINKIRNEKGEITTDTAETQRIIRNYLHANKYMPNKLDNKQEAHKFLERGNFSWLNQKEIDNMINYQYWNWVSNLKTPTEKSPVPDGFTGEFYHLEKR